VGPESLNPAQQDVLERLGATKGERPTFPADLRDELRKELRQHLAPVVEALGGDSMFLSKRVIEQSHGCEVANLDEEARPFAWSVPMARGVLAHKAIELSLSYPNATPPLVLVEEAMASLMSGDRSIGDYLRTCGETARAELASAANGHLSQFLEQWPPLKKEWRPVLEQRLRHEIADGHITLDGRPDLTIGRPEGDSGDGRGNVAGKVIVDFKTGYRSEAHVADMRFYALLDALVVGVPPRLVATYYLDQGELHAEPVTLALVHSAIDRTVAAAFKLVELRQGREPVRLAGPRCRWCALRSECDAGTAYVDGLDLDRVDGD
jgi:hypothetical protein